MSVMQVQMAAIRFVSTVLEHLSVNVTMVMSWVKVVLVSQVYVSNVLQLYNIATVVQTWCKSKSSYTYEVILL